MNSVVEEERGKICRAMSGIIIKYFQVEYFFVPVAFIKIRKSSDDFFDFSGDYFGRIFRLVRHFVNGIPKIWKLLHREA